ncbi:MAG: hypothetical protein KJ556_21945, partial [Gammaproteobacteria bacterium]|nr:hypothetical protein [Gammaproteobacteria bacterium]
IKDMQPDWVVLPRMYALDAFHRICKVCGAEHQQGSMSEKCEQCGGIEYDKKIIWLPKKNKKTDYMWFDINLRMAYFDANYLSPYGKDIEELKKKYSHKIRPFAKHNITDVMCGIGACWFLERERFWAFGGLDEAHGSWGQMAVEIACKAWLSGGRHVVNKNTWFAHLSRTQPGFSWPYPISNGEVEVARKHSKELWLNNKWDRQKRQLSFIIDKFSPLPGWDKSNHCKRAVKKGIIYYTDNCLQERFAIVVRNQLKRIANGHEVISVSQWPIDFGFNITTKEQRSVLTMFKQILLGLEKSNADIVFLCEHDVIYHKSHFNFEPEKKDVYYYNVNVWKVDAKTGQALYYYTKQTSGLCAYRDLLVEHYRKRIEIVEKNGFKREMGFEPGTHQPPRGIDTHTAKDYYSDFPNIDIRHDNNLTANRFKKEQFRSEKSIQGWKESGEIFGWGITKGRFNEFLKELV